MPVAAETLRTRRFPLSAMNMLPDGSTATAYGNHKDALVAGMLSPAEYPLLPLPATVVIKPVLIVILRIRLLKVSAM